MNIFATGWIHHKNKQALGLLGQYGINFHSQYDRGMKYDQIQIFDRITRISGQDCPKIYGPHFYWWQTQFDLQEGEYYRTLTPPQDELVKSVKPDLSTFCMPFPVDVDLWTPKEKTGKPVAYFKNRDMILFQEVLDVFGKDLVVINYDQGYNEKDYVDAINKAPYCVWVGRHESQGFAFQEAMSCDTPMFVIDVKSLRDEPSFVTKGYGDLMKADSDLPSTAATYFDDTCGVIAYEDDWQDKIEQFMGGLGGYSPRQFVVDHLSPKVLAERLVEENAKL
jgi:hypothetical protein